jgi:hypothetical protein
MFKFLREMVPLAGGTALLGLVIAWLVASDNAIGVWLFAAFLVGHGWIHVMYVMPRRVAQPALAGAPDWPFELDRSWLLPGMSATGLHGLGVVLVVVTVVGFLLAGLATILVLVPAGAWAALMLTATTCSALLMVLFFRPGLVIGLAVDAVLYWVVLATLWVPGV